MSIDCDVAAALEDAVRRRVGDARYNLWFDRRTRLSWDASWLTVGVPNLHFQEWLQKTFGAAVADAAQEVFGAPLPVRFVIDAQLFQAARREQATTPAPTVDPVPSALPPPSPRTKKKAPPQPTLFAEPEPKPEPKPTAPKPGRRWRKLSDFVVGPCNRVAHASAVAAVEEPGQGGNPLVLHGPTGTGKTHLLEGIYLGLRKARPAWRVVYVTAEDFTNRFVQAMRFGKLAGFRRHFRECDALLVDDLHFLASKKATQEEFLHTCDDFLAEGRPLAVACDCHPRLADEFVPELTDRLLGGAVWGLTPPDAETRRALLRARAVGAPSIPDAVVDLLAVRLRGNVRELEGALHGLRHYSRVTGRPVDRALAEEALADLLRHAVRVVGLGDVDAAVCRALGLEAGTLQSKARTWAVSHPRMLAMFLARKHTAASFGEVGAHFGGRNHSTAVAAEKKVRKWLTDDAELVAGARRGRVRELVERVERELLR